MGCPAYASLGRCLRGPAAPLAASEDASGDVRRGAAARVRRRVGSMRIPSGRLRRLVAGFPPGVPEGTGRGSEQSVERRGGVVGPAALDSPAARRSRTPRQESWCCLSSVPPVVVGEARSGLVASDRSAAVWVAVACRRQGHDQHPPGDLGAHQPVRWRFRRVEEWVVGPDVVDVVQPEVWVFEQVCGLRADLEGGPRREDRARSGLPLCQCITNDYESSPLLSKGRHVRDPGHPTVGGWLRVACRGDAALGLAERSALPVPG